MKKYFYVIIQILFIIYNINIVKNIQSFIYTKKIFRNSFMNLFVKKSQLFYNPLHISFLTKTTYGSFFSNSNKKYIYKNQNNENKKKLICLSPGGFKGFYMTGIITFIKDNYDTSDYIFSGASAGAWNAVILSFKGNVHTFLNKVLGNKTKVTKKERINDFEIYLKNKILDNFCEEDFNLDQIYIGVTTLHPNIWYNYFNNYNENLLNITVPKVSLLSQQSKYNFVRTNVFYNFTNLEDVLNCCIASSHIPLITGGIINKYRNYYAFDGGFSNYPYYDLIEPELFIHPGMWENTNKKTNELSTLLYKEKYDFYELYEKGYNDTVKNRKILDKIFLKKIT